MDEFTREHSMKEDLKRQARDFVPDEDGHVEEKHDEQNVTKTIKIAPQISLFTQISSNLIASETI